MKTHGGGTKRSSWATFRRRLLLVRMLLRRPASRDDLIAAINAELVADGYPGDAYSALKKDFDTLKSEYGCDIHYERRTGHYALVNLGDLALLDLPDHCMEALAFLEASFPPGAAIPDHANVRELLERILVLLPARRRDQHAEKRSAMALHVGTAASRIDPDVFARVKRAIEVGQEVAFDYLSTFDRDTPRRHRVAPYTIIFRPEGHGYLDATLLEVTPRGGEAIRAAIEYRLDRIIPGSVAILPTKLPPYRPHPPVYQIRYTLLPVVARRRDVGAYFPNTQMSYHEDGSATVTASVTNLWQTRQILLRYGTACEVLEPPELVDLFRETARGLGRIYGTEHTPDV